MHKRKNISRRKKGSFWKNIYWALLIKNENLKKLLNAICPEKNLYNFLSCKIRFPQSSKKKFIRKEGLLLLLLAVPTSAFGSK